MSSPRTRRIVRDWAHTHTGPVADQVRTLMAQGGIYDDPAKALEAARNILGISPQERRSAGVSDDEHALIALLRLGGVRGTEVAQLLCVTQNTVSAKYRAANKAALDAMGRKLEQKVAELVARNQHIADEARRLAIEAEEAEDHAAVARHMANELKAEQAIERILGAAAPERHEHTGKDGGPIEVTQLSDDALLRLAGITPADSD